MAYENIKLTREGGIFTITLDRPEKRNALNRGIRTEISLALKEIGRDEDARVVIFCGNKVFCAGADLAELKGRIRSAEDGYETSREFQTVFQEVNNYPLPTVAAISGYALGGGCELALVCDFRIIADNARIGFPEIQLGAYPAGGATQILTRIIGATKAKEMLFTGEPLDAQEALRIGLVNKVVPSARLMEETREFANRLARISKRAMRATKTAVNSSLYYGLSSGLELEARTFANIASSLEEMTKGVERVLGKG